MEKYGGQFIGQKVCIFLRTHLKLQTFQEFNLWCSGPAFHPDKNKSLV